MHTEAASAMAMVQAQNDWVSDTESDTSEDEQPRRKVVKPKVQAPKETVAQAPQADEVIGKRKAHARSAHGAFV